MSVKVNINPSLTYLTDGEESIDVEGNDVGQCLKQVVARFPELRGSLFGKDGKLDNHVDIYVNMESAYPEELAKPVNDGDEIYIIAQVAGG
ncbi:MoaD/ThiS family protein [Chloroflexota bacterium]